MTVPAESFDVVCLLNIETGFFNQCAQDVAAIVLNQKVPIPTLHHARNSGKDGLS